jgi:hypothetical protein
LRKECDVVRKKTAACILDVLTFVVFTCRYRRQDMSKYPALAVERHVFIVEPVGKLTHSLMKDDWIIPQDFS